MSQDHPPFFELISRRFEMLREQRAQLVEDIRAIDAKLAMVAADIGIGPDEVALPPIDVQRLPKREHHKSAGSMAAFTRELFNSADRGYTRMELRDLISAEKAEWAERIKHNPNGFYNMVKRATVMNVIKEIDGVLYPFSRAPAEDDRETSLPLQLPDNVTPIAPAERSR